jgi:hypothetical protein
MSWLTDWRDAVLSEYGPREPNARLVACALAKHSNARGGSCFPSQRTLASETGLKRKTVRRHLANLESEGWITIQQAGQSGQGWKRHSYALLMPQRGGVGNPASTGKVGEQLLHVTEEGGVNDDPNVGSRLPTRTPIEDTHTHTEGFDELWSAYPKREGGNSKKAAFRAYKARLRDGVRPDELLEGVTRYARYCDSADPPLTGTRFVKQAATFLGPDEHWRESWEDGRPNTPPLYPDL